MPMRCWPTRAGPPARSGYSMPRQWPANQVCSTATLEIRSKYGTPRGSPRIRFCRSQCCRACRPGEPKDALPQLFGGRNVVCGVTLGAAGVMWFDGKTVSSAPSPRVKVVDTLAAGDTWHGAFALALAERKELQAAIEFATAVAALKCTRFGGRAGIPKRDQFERWWASVDRG